MMGVVFVLFILVWALFLMRRLEREDGGARPPHELLSEKKHQKDETDKSLSEKIGQKTETEKGE